MILGMPTITSVLYGLASEKRKEGRKGRKEGGREGKTKGSAYILEKKK